MESVWEELLVLVLCLFGVTVCGGRVMAREGGGGGVEEWGTVELYGVQ
jgi:hypothetical protein